MNILKSILKGRSNKSDNSSVRRADIGMTLDEGKTRVEELRRSISGLKKRHERSIQLKAATCNTGRSIKKLQSEIALVRRRFPSIASASQDSYRV